MPSLEIICIGQTRARDFSFLPFHVEAERERLSHRGANSLFQSDFDALSGCIYHLGGSCLRFPSVRKRHAYTAADLCTEWWDCIHFKPRYRLGVAILLDTLLNDSPEGRLLFTSDYQFGPTETRRFQRPLTPMSFWRRHDAGLLRTNAAFTLTRGR